MKCLYIYVITDMFDLKSSPFGTKKHKIAFLVVLKQWDHVIFKIYMINFSYSVRISNFVALF